jgi:hypothetical protein
MARSIVLRFPTVCHDCGRSLPAGTTARWFGKGRVSCCGNPTTKPGDYSPAAVPSSPLSSMPNRVHAVPGAAGNGAPRFGDGMLDAELARAVACGLNSAQLARLAEVCPGQTLVVRLRSGARFLVSAQHAQHVIACIEESMRDKVRDVMGAAQ